MRTNPLQYTTAKALPALQSKIRTTVDIQFEIDHDHLEEDGKTLEKIGEIVSRVGRELSAGRVSVAQDIISSFSVPIRDDAD